MYPKNYKVLRTAQTAWYMSWEMPNTWLHCFSLQSLQLKIKKGNAETFSKCCWPSILKTKHPKRKSIYPSDDTRVAFLNSRLTLESASEQKAPYIATASTYNLYLSSSAPYTDYLPHSIPFVFFSHSIFCLKQLSSFYVPRRILSLSFNTSLHQFPPASLFHSAPLGSFHCYYPCCTTGALLQSSHTLSFKMTSVGLKTFCKAHLMGQSEISDLTVNSCSLLAVHPAVITNSSIQNKSPKGNMLT